jgi:hypothetical protein
MKREEIALASRLINLADVVEVYGRAGGVGAAIGVARERRATQFDPDLVDAFCELAPVLLPEIDEAPSWEAVIAAEPGLASEVTEEGLDEALEAIGEFAELKPAWVMGSIPTSPSAPFRRHSLRWARSPASTTSGWTAVGIHEG